MVTGIGGQASLTFDRVWPVPSGARRKPAAGSAEAGLAARDVVRAGAAPSSPGGAWDRSLTADLNGLDAMRAAGRAGRSSRCRNTSHGVERCLPDLDLEGRSRHLPRAETQGGDKD
jgi:hypothetical protein